MDVGKCEFKECIKFNQCYRNISKASVYDFEKICNEENEYKWFILNKNVESTINSEESEKANE